MKEKNYDSEVLVHTRYEHCVVLNLICVPVPGYRCSPSPMVRFVPSRFSEDGGSQGRLLPRVRERETQGVCIHS